MLADRFLFYDLSEKIQKLKNLTSYELKIMIQKLLSRS
jgi:hypothetical protein